MDPYSTQMRYSQQPNHLVAFLTGIAEKRIAQKASDNYMYSVIGSSMHMSTSGGSDAYQQTTAGGAAVTGLVASDASQDQADGDDSVGSAHFFASNLNERRKGVDEEANVEEIGIKETSTFVLLSLSSICVSDEDADRVEQIKANNQKYLEVLCKLFNFFLYI